MIKEFELMYLKDRVDQVDSDFLQFEEEMISSLDQDRIRELLRYQGRVLLPNSHNSILLYVLGISNEFDHKKARSDTVGGTPPDIDIDFHDRATAIDWTVNRWGDDNVAKILTHGTYGVKSGTEKFFKTIEPAPVWNASHTGKLNQGAFDHNYRLQTKIEEAIPEDVFGKSADMKKVFETHPDLLEDDALAAWRAYMDYVEDKLFAYSVHASGVVVSDFPLWEIMPLMAEYSQTVAEDGTDITKISRITQLTMSEVEYLGAIKFDFLGIDNLSIVELAIKLVKERHNIDLDMYAIPDGDKLTYDLLAQGMLTGIFQFETSGSAKRLVVTTKPQSVDELSALSALNRPGPLAKRKDPDTGVEHPSIADMYVENKANGYAPSDLPDALADLLEPTYWAMVYQEQVMKICSELAGFSLREADDIRRAMGKKKKEVIEPMKDMFMTGAAAVGKIDAEAAAIVWQQMMAFADYAFNKSHSVCYSYLSYVCAWLKANYPEEFFCALLTIRSGGTATKWDKAPEFVYEAKARNIQVRGPSINRSHSAFTLADNSLYWGFQAIKGIGATTGDSVAQTRGSVKFTDIWDFLDRVDRSRLNVGAFKALALAGAFDCMGYDRETLHRESVDLYEQIKLEEKAIERRQRLQEVEAENILRELRKAELDAQLDAAKARKKAKQEPTAEDIEIVDRANRLRRLRELARQCKLSSNELSSVMTKEEEMEYEESQWLRSAAVPKVPDVPVRKLLPRHKQVPVTIAGLKMQREYCGAYPAVHPVQLEFPNSKSLASVEEGDYGVFAGEVLSLFEYRTKKGQMMAFATLEDSTSRAELVIFPQVWNKLVRDGISTKLDKSICQIKARVEQLEPLKLIVDTVKL